MPVEPMNGVIGATITGVDLAKEAPIDDLVEALDRYLVVVLPEQDLSPARQTEITNLFGPPCPTPFVKTMAEYPQVIKVLKEADEANAFNFGGAWHSDFSFLDKPPSYTLLHAIDVPAYGGDTVWTNNIAALDQLLANVRARIDRPDAQGVHTAKDAYSPKMQVIHDGLKHMEITTTEDANDLHTHPLITTHPGNGKEALFFNQAYVRDLANVDVAPEEMDAFMRGLHHHTTSHQFTVRHRWRNGDLAIWDNRATQHLALNDYGGFRRELHRTTVQGGVPTR
jgi:taurine dioxygenase